jgi:hypothetical protein
MSVKFTKNGQAEETGSIASRALAKASQSRAAALRLAKSGLERADAKALSQAAEAGWNPSMQGDWHDLAMKESSGASIEWLMERFPLDTSLSALMTDPSSDSWQADHARWSVKAMLAAEDFAAGRAPLSRWIAACSRSEQAGAYFEQSLAHNPMWSQALEGRFDSLSSSGAISALCIPVLRQRSQAAAAACVEFCAARLPKLMAKADEGELKAMRTAVASLAFSLMSEGRPWAPIAALLDVLPEWMLAMGNKGVPQIKGDAGSQRRQIETVGRELATPKTARISARQSDPCWELGAYALVGGPVEDVELALSKGWIGPAMVAIEQKCEDPDFIAYDEARAVTRLGRAIDTSERWLKCEQIIRSARMPEAQREQFLARIEKRDPSAWAEGKPKLHVVSRERPTNPMALMLVCSAALRKKGDGQEAKAQLLSEAGFRLKDAVASSDPLSGEVLAVIKNMGWARSLLEREELEEIARPATSRGRRLSL